MSDVDEAPFVISLLMANKKSFGYALRLAQGASV
jgi:hypothetical protein